MSGQPSDWEDVEDDWEDVSPSKTNFSNVKSGSSSSTNGFRQSVLSHPTTIDDYAPESEPDTYTGGFMKGLNDYATELGQGMFKSAAQPESLGDFAGLMLPTSIGRGIGATKGLAKVGKAIEETPRNISPLEKPRIKLKVGETIGPKGEVIPPKKPLDVETLDSPKIEDLGGHDWEAVPSNEPGIVPNEGIKAAPSVIEPEAQAIRDQTAPTTDTNFIKQVKGEGIANEMSEGPRQIHQATPDELSGMNQRASTRMDAEIKARKTIAASGQDPKIIPRNKLVETAQGIDPEFNNAGPITSDDIKVNTSQHELPKMLDEISGDANIIKMSPTPERPGLIREALNTQRTILTSFDLSAPGRQGLPLIGRKEYWTSFDDMFKSWGSERAYQTVQESIREHPSGLFKSPGISEITGKPLQSYADKVGLSLTDMVGHNEEVFRARLADKIPGVTRSNRAYIAFLNKTRSDTFASMVDLAKKQGKNPETDLVLGKQIADFINNATGRGSLGKLEPIAKELSDVFFAPRLMASRVKTYTQVLNPKFYTELDPMVRKEALKSLFAVAGTGLLVGETARLAGAAVSNDPTNSDFRKIKIGNTRIDPFGGFQQYPVAAMKLLTGKSTSSTSGRTTDLTAGRFGQQTRQSIASNFLSNKLAPIPSFVWSWMGGKDFDGTPFDAKEALLQRTVPIVMQDIADLMKEDPSLVIPGAAASIMGVGVQTYGR